MSTRHKSESTKPSKLASDLKHGNYWEYAGSHSQGNLEKKKSKILNPSFQFSDIKARKWNHHPPS